MKTLNESSETDKIIKQYGLNNIARYIASGVPKAYQKACQSEARGCLIKLCSLHAQEIESLKSKSIMGLSVEDRAILESEICSLKKENKMFQEEIPAWQEEYESLLSWARKAYEALKPFAGAEELGYFTSGGFSYPSLSSNNPDIFSKATDTINQAPESVKEVK